MILHKVTMLIVRLKRHTVIGFALVCLTGFLWTGCTEWTVDSAGKKLYQTPQIETLTPVGQPGYSAVSVQAKLLNIIETPLLSVGICYSINNPNPTIADQTVKINQNFQAVNTFLIEDLAPGKQYTYRAFAISNANKDVPVYGIIRTFTTAEIVPDVHTLGLLSTPSSTSAQAQMQINNISQLKLKEIGICFSLNNSIPTLADNVTRSDKTTEFRSVNTFSLNELAPSTIYYYRAYAITPLKENEPFYGNILSFVTPPRTP